MSIEDLALAPALGCPAPNMPLVGQLGCDAQRTALSTPADEDGQNALNGFGVARCVVELKEVASQGGPRRAQQRTNRSAGLFERSHPGPDGRQRHAVGGVFVD